MSTTLLIIHLIVASALVGIILLQRSEGGGLGIGGGGDFMSRRGSGNFLTRTTAVLAAIFMGLSMILTLTSQSRIDTPSIIDVEDDDGFDGLPLIPLEGDSLPPLPPIGDP
ncbi:MAG: preprotein translocase subunit SecG [Alphaproteobacteria bacterium GM202ARS2]|nr:preprotein translocase subunit SecG [Alphaproteobacteria bacterium GM202ARS2]